MAFTPNEVYSMLLTLGIHPSDEQYREWLHSLDLDEEKEDIGLDPVVHFVLSHCHETSVSLTHYVTAYLHFKHSKRWRALPTPKSVESAHSVEESKSAVDAVQRGLDHLQVWCLTP